MANFLFIESLDIRKKTIEDNHPKDYVMMIDEYDDEERFIEVLNMLQKHGILDKEINTRLMTVELCSKGYYYGDLFAVILNNKGQANILRDEFGIYLVHFWFPDENRWT